MTWRPLVQLVAANPVLSWTINSQIRHLNITDSTKAGNSIFKENESSLSQHDCLLIVRYVKYFIAMLEHQKHQFKMKSDPFCSNTELEIASFDGTYDFNPDGQAIRSISSLFPSS